MLKKFISFLMATAVAVSFSMSVVAEDVVAGEDVAIVATIEESIDTANTISIIAADSCKHKMFIAGSGTGSRSGGTHWFSTSTSFESCNITEHYRYTNHYCEYGCGYTYQEITSSTFVHANPRCTG